jgi:AcrR family transcriptional regulator
MTPRRSAAEAVQTRTRLLDSASALASTDGLEGVTLGRLAGATRLSKSGVTRHFPTKEELQLRTLEHAFARFAAVVWRPGLDRPGGLERLRAVCDAWTAFLAGDTFPGGCFMTGVAAEFDGRPGPVRDAVAAAQRRWLGLLAAEARRAIDGGELPDGTDPEQLAFQLNALALGANQARQLLDDEDAPRRARRLMEELFGRAGAQAPPAKVSSLRATSRIEA